MTTPQNMRFLGPRAYQQQAQAKAALAGALTVLKQMQQTGRMPLPIGMDPTGDPSMMIGQGQQMLGMPPPVSGMSPTGPSVLGAASAMTQPPPALMPPSASISPMPVSSTMPPPAAGPRPFALGGVMGAGAPGIAQQSPTYQPTPIIPTGKQMPEDDTLLPGVVPASKLVPLIAGLLQKKREAGPTGDSIAADVGARAGIAPSSPPTDESLPAAPVQSIARDTSQESDTDYILRAMSAPPPPAAFISWVSNADPKTLPEGAAAIVHAYQANPHLGNLIHQAALDLADNAPAELPQALRDMLARKG